MHDPESQNMEKLSQIVTEDFKSSKMHVIQMQEMESGGFEVNLEQLEKGHSENVIKELVDAPDKSEKGCCAPLAFIPEAILGRVSFLKAFSKPSPNLDSNI
jgi:hypothetical protein